MTAELGPAESQRFWRWLDELVATSELVIDRPRGSRHPRYRDLVYPLDYGYLAGTSSADGGGIDVWSGSQSDRTLDAIMVTVDLTKRDSEIKLLLGCTEAERQAALDVLNRESMAALLIHRPLWCPLKLGA